MFVQKSEAAVATEADAKFISSVRLPRDANYCGTTSL